MKRSIVRLFVAVVTLISALVELAIRIVHLAILLVDHTARWFVGETQRLVPALETPPKAPVLIQAPSGAEQRLVGALTGPSLGFPVRSARAFAATVRARLVTEPIDGLVREGIVHLSQAS